MTGNLPIHIIVVCMTKARSLQGPLILYIGPMILLGIRGTSLCKSCGLCSVCCVRTLGARRSTCRRRTDDRKSTSSTSMMPSGENLFVSYKGARTMFILSSPSIITHTFSSLSVSLPAPCTFYLLHTATKTTASYH